MSSVAVVTTVHGRLGHLVGLRRGLARQDVDVQHVVVRMGGPSPWQVCQGWPPVVPVELTSRCGPDAGRLPLAAARNAGAAAVEAELLVFLDVDCIPSSGLVRRYVEVAGAVGGLLAGTVSYLPDRLVATDLDETALRAAADPHPARPAPARDELLLDDRYELFWSLSFAVSRSDLASIGGFCEEYVGYGGEDTDLAFSARALGLPLTWVGGADAWHQWHPVEDPPRRHLTDIVRNASVFRRRWGVWPMVGWLQAFAEDGLVEWDPDGPLLRVTH